VEDILVPIAFFAAVVLIVYFSNQTKMRRLKMEHEERLLAIEKGVALPQKQVEKHSNPYTWPIILIALGLAIMVSNTIDGDYEDIGWALLPLFAGIGMFYTRRHFIKQNAMKNAMKQEEQEKWADRTSSNQPPPPITPDNKLTAE
jgi:fatty acid desaturase